MNTLKRYTQTPLITISESGTMQEACEKMRENNLRHLVVLDFQGHLIGIISEKDIQRAIRQSKLSEYNFRQVIPPNEMISDYLSWPVFTIPDDAHPSTAAKEMLQQKISALVILNNCDMPIGIITTDDILKIYVEESTSENTKNILIKRLFHHDSKL